jgi:hypothetical protein
MGNLVVTSGVTPKLLIRGEWFVTTAVLTGLVWVLVYAIGDNIWVAAGFAFVVGFTFRLTALYRGLEEPLAREPTGTYIHTEGRPLFGRKLYKKSQRELRDLGLLVDEPAGALVPSPAETV